MNLLLDTHTFIWFVDDDANLSGAARALIVEPANTIFVSMASLWEMAIKISLGKLSLSQPLDVFVPEQLRINRFAVLDIGVAHVLDVARLPFHHRDPFDRLLIAQSRVETIPIVTSVRDKGFTFRLHYGC